MRARAATGSEPRRSSRSAGGSWSASGGQSDDEERIDDVRRGESFVVESGGMRGGQSDADADRAPTPWGRESLRLVVTCSDALRRDPRDKLCEWPMGMRFGGGHCMLGASESAIHVPWSTLECRDKAAPEPSLAGECGRCDVGDSGRCDDVGFDSGECGEIGGARPPDGRRESMPFSSGQAGVKRSARSRASAACISSAECGALCRGTLGTAVGHTSRLSEIEGRWGDHASSSPHTSGGRRWLRASPSTPTPFFCGQRFALGSAAKDARGRFPRIKRRCSSASCSASGSSGLALGRPCGASSFGPFGCDSPSSSTMLIKAVWDGVRHVPRALASRGRCAPSLIAVVKCRWAATPRSR